MTLATVREVFVYIIVKILTTMAQAVPGAGAVISSLMIANNIEGDDLRRSKRLRDVRE